MAGQIRTELTERVDALGCSGVISGLGTLLAGEGPGSAAYVNGKYKDCAQVGIVSHLPGTASQEDVEDVIRELNDDPACTGYIVQLLLPGHLDTNRILELIDPRKDADGLHPINLGRLVLGEQAPLPCTPRGIVELLTRHGISLNGANVCIVGRGVTVGRPLGLLLTRRSENATVTLCHTGTRDLPRHLGAADIVVAAAGSPHLLTDEHVKPGATVIDVGIARTEQGLVGDVHPSVRSVAAWIAPMPGGAGPMTRAMLLADIVEAAEVRLVTPWAEQQSRPTPA